MTRPYHVLSGEKSAHHGQTPFRREKGMLWTIAPVPAPVAGRLKGKKWALRPKKKCHRMILFLGSSFSSSLLFLGPVTLLAAVGLSLFFVPDELIYSGSFNASERMFAPLCFPRELEWGLC